MKLRCYSVRDNAVGAYMRPMFARSDAEMTRSFSDEVNREGSEIGRHPGDYGLYYVGEFDEISGRFTAPDDPHSMGLATSYVARPRVVGEVAS